MQRLNSILIGVFSKILFYLILILIWETIFQIGVKWLQIWKPYTFPSPAFVLRSLIKLTQSNVLPIAIATSLRRIMIGYTTSIGIGTLIGVLMVSFKFLDKHLSSLVLGLQTLPSICWLPFAILWFGLNENAITFVIAIGSTFAIAMSIESGIKNVNPLFIRAARTMGSKGYKLYRTVIIPAAMPNIVMGLKQAWSFAWRALMAGEMLTATKGLGQVLMWGRDLADISQVMGVMIVIIILGLVVDKLVFSAVEKNIRHKWGLLHR
ncbi:MAG: ABC transporter permease [Tissierellales bacterium]|nr:ABC transporter permease [Tissierellales bacterium]MBN2827316.1 ABC transporter permease [Tissierellales bacterium]